MTIPPSDKQIKVAIIGCGVPTKRDLWLLERLQEHLGKEVVHLDFNSIEERALIAAQDKMFRTPGQFFVDEVIDWPGQYHPADKPTKHDVGTYAAMFGQPAKTYTPPHKAKRKGKRK